MREHVSDVVIIGAGVAGLLAAVAARRLGFDVLILESSNLVGGDTATTAGQMWLPATHLATKVGVLDSEEDALNYLNNILGAETEASTSQRRSVFTHTAPNLARWLASSNLPLNVERGVPDYHRAEVGGLPQGRVITTSPSDRRSLGPWATKLRSKNPVGFERKITRAVRQLTNNEGHSATGGEALAAELLRRATANGVDIWLAAEIVAFLPGDDGINGIQIRKDDDEITVTAQIGVLLAVGGFAGNQKLREDYLPLPTNASWSLMGQNTGKLLQKALDIGAKTAAMNDAWWTPVTVLNGTAYSLDAARKAPHSIIVDQAGDRFLDEAAPPAELVRSLFKAGRGVKTIPSYLILDNRHRNSIPLGPWEAGESPFDASEDEIISARTLNDLAVALDIDRAGLIGTIVRFNGFAHKGEDTDFHRGESIWSRFELTGKRGKKLASLGKLDKKPFWAVKVYPGDQGTKGGLLINDHSQVLREDGSWITGLYACGGTAASMMKGTSPGPGAALSEALIEAYLAVLDMERRRKSL